MATICWARMSSGASRSAIGVDHAACARAHDGRALEELVAREREEPALGRAPSAWPERPMRCSAVAIERGEPTRHARSTAPTSMPSSSEAVATTTRSSPALRRCSASRRRARERLPWCAATRALAEPLAEVVRDALDEAARVHEDERGAVLRDEVGEAIVELGPLLVGAHRAELVARDLDGEIEVAPLARRRRLAAAAGPRPTSSRAATSMGRTVAERPMRCGRAPPARRTRSSRRSTESARCAPRLSRGDGVDLVEDDRAHVRRALRRPDAEVSRMKSDSGVVTSTCGGAADVLCRSLRGRVAGAHGRADGRGRARRARRPAAAISAMGCSRFFWTSLESALSGET